jgi:hypothetical protein
MATCFARNIQDEKMQEGKFKKENSIRKIVVTLLAAQ